jgi:Flp pilus assembly protein TadG
MMRIKAFFKNQDGGPAAEFALVLPIALLFLFGIIDVGRFMWEYNKAEKATQMGARFAAVTELVPSTLATTNFVSTTVPQGDPVPSGAFGGTRCTSGSCSTAPTNACPAGTPAGGTNWGYGSAAFTNILVRMQAFKPDVTAANVVIDYANAGLGYAGDPIGPDVAPLITVRLCQLIFRPITTQIFNATVAMPDFSYSLTMEDGAGAVSN